MVNCFIDLLKCILCCDDEPYYDPDWDSYHDHDDFCISIIQDLWNSLVNLFSRREESGRSRINSASTYVYIPSHASSGSNSITRIPEKQGFVSSSTSHGQVVTPSSASVASSVPSYQPRPKRPEPSQPRVVVVPPATSYKPPNESVSKPSCTHSPSVSFREQAPSSKPPPVPSSTSKPPPPPIPKPSQPHVTVLPPTASSKPRAESVSKPHHTHSPSVSYGGQASSSKLPPFASSSASSSVKPPPVASSRSNTSPAPNSSSFGHHERDLEPVKAVLSRVSSEGNEALYMQEDTSPIYMIPEEIQDIIKRDEVPGILRNPLTPWTYKDYFATLLYAEDFHVEKWKKFELKGVSLQLHEASVIKQRKDKNQDVKDNRIFVAFKIDSVPEKRPFFLSRDFVFAKPVGKQDKKFQGIIYRVQKSTQVLVHFEDSFYVQHSSRSRYDISFSFNRVCLKRAHQALEAAMHPSFENFLFPRYPRRHDYLPRSPSGLSLERLDLDQQSAIRHILGLKGSPPYLVEGPTSVQYSELSTTGVLVREAVLEIYRVVKSSRILVSAPKNRTCDVLMSNLKEHIPESVMFRANAAFRDVNEVPEDIFSSCQYQDDCFTCPPLKKLKKFNVVFSTFVSGFRLHYEGMEAGHFSHIFLVDASEAIEPEVMITLANFANDDTSVVVTGSPFTGSLWLRSDIARRNGLSKSYLERLRERALYKTLDSEFITQLKRILTQKTHR